MDPLEAQIRQVFFFDTPDLTLNEQGVVVRARRIQGKGDDSVVKLRPVVPGRAPGRAAEVAELRRRGRRDAGRVRLLGVDEGNAGKADVRQRRAAGADPQALLEGAAGVLRANAPDGISLDDLAILGPIFVLKLRFAPKELGRRLVAEVWLYPDGSRILELSTKCAPSEAFQVAAEARAFLAGRGVDLSGDQETKTRKALDVFAKPLRAAGSPGG